MGGSKTPFLPVSSRVPGGLLVASEEKRGADRPTWALLFQGVAAEVRTPQERSGKAKPLAGSGRSSRRRRRQSWDQSRESQHVSRGWGRGEGRPLPPQNQTFMPPRRQLIVAAVLRQTVLRSIERSVRRQSAVRLSVHVETAIGWRQGAAVAKGPGP